MILAASHWWLPALGNLLHLPAEAHALVLVHLVASSASAHAQQGLQAAKLARLAAALLAAEHAPVLLSLLVFAALGHLSWSNAHMGLRPVPRAHLRSGSCAGVTLDSHKSFVRLQVLRSTHLFHASLVGVLAARLARRPLTVLTRHFLDQAWLIGTRVHDTLDGWMARAADRVVVLSQAIRNHLISREGVPAECIEVIYQGFDFTSPSPTEEDRHRVRAELGIDRNFAIGCVASFRRRKGMLIYCPQCGKSWQRHRRLVLFSSEVVTGPRSRLLFAVSG